MMEVTAQMNSESIIFPQVPKNIFMLGLTGCSTSGKTTLCKNFENHFSQNETKLTVIHQDIFYKPEEYIYGVLKGNWEVKESVDWKKFVDHISTVISQVNPNEKHLILIDGFTVFYEAGFYDLFDAVIFMHLDDENVIKRRLIGPWNDTIEYLNDCVIKDYKKYKVDSIKELLEREKQFILLDGRIPKDQVFNAALSWYLSLKKN